MTLTALRTLSWVMVAGTVSSALLLSSARVDPTATPRASASHPSFAAWRAAPGDALRRAAMVVRAAVPGH